MTSLDGLELAPGTPAQRAPITTLVWSTGPASYAYIFGRRTTFDAFVGASWAMPDTYFGHTEATVALVGGRVVGVEIGFDGARSYRTKANLAGVATRMVADGIVTDDELEGVLTRADAASYLNPFVPDAAYYVLALAVSDDVRGTGVGAALLANAMTRGRRAGCRALHLDVLSDNPAVGFYRAHGLVTMAETIAPVPCREHGVPMELRMVTSLTGGDA
jgi:ribosomal protein S18 acetylase RimI-like enzyme